MHYHRGDAGESLNKEEIVNDKKSSHYRPQVAWRTIAKEH